MITLQETNISAVAAPGMAHVAKNLGWQLLHVPCSRYSTNRGGVAILCRSPFPLVEVSRQDRPEGQFAIAQIATPTKTIYLTTHYRHRTDMDFTTLRS